MMRSLYSGVSGLRNHQTRMDVIGNNIANVNTIGYKTSRTVFQDVYSQTSKNASAAGESFGGTNPLQIGLGVKLAAVDVLHTASAQQRTDNPMDFMVEGDGFFIVQGLDQLLYTRAGNFYLDSEGNIVTSGGNYVQGVMGTSHTLTEDELDYQVDANGEITMNPGLVGDGVSVGDEDNKGTIMLGTDGYYYQKEVLPVTDPPTYEADLDRPYLIYDRPADAITNFNGITGAIDSTAMTKINVKGFKDMEIDDKGIVKGLTEDGRKVVVAYLAMANFENASGLKKEGSSQYSATSNSGAAIFTTAQNNGVGTVVSGSLEMSNVDLAAEFTDMIVTQRGFQANSRVITVSDTLLEELINLKR